MTLAVRISMDLTEFGVLVVIVLILGAVIGGALVKWTRRD